jgi:exodeoxyribonuclease V alpha subunit
VHLQRVLNKETLTIIKGSKMFKIGDRIMQSVNNYDKNVFNGDIGRIIEINYEEHNVIVKYDEQTVFYDFEELDELMLSYAITVHKSQGCEFKAVVMPLHAQHFRMLQRNLLYTGITRAKELMCLVGNVKAVQIAVKNNYVSKRYTGLVHRLVI